LSEVVLRPTFPAEELDLYKRNTVEHLKFQRSQPGFLAGEQAARLIFGSHPYSRVSPTANDIDKLDRQALMRRHTEIFIPNDAVLVVIGDIKRDEFLAELRDHFGEWQTGIKQKSEFGRSPARNSRTLTVVDRPGSAQSNIVLANFTIERDHPDYFPLIVMNQVLGAGASSRVFMNLREEKGYTYGAYTRLDTKRLAGSFEATAEVRTAVTGDSLKEFFYELNRIRETKVGVEELRDAKEFLTGVFPLRAETQEGLTNLVLNQHLYGLPEDYLQTYRENINKITADDVQRVANAHVRPDEIAIVIVGDAEEVLPQIRDYADTLEVFDTEGKEQDKSKYAVTLTSELANAAGKWDLTVDFQGQNLPVSLTLAQDSAAITGEMDTMLGKGTIVDGTINENKISATVQAEMQGQPVEFAIMGKLDGDAMSGTITTPMVPDPLPFTGNRDGTAQKSAA